MVYVAREPVKLMFVTFALPTLTGFVKPAVNVHPVLRACTIHVPLDSPTSMYVPSLFVHVVRLPANTRTPSTPVPFSVTVPLMRYVAGLPKRVATLAVA